MSDLTRSGMTRIESPLSRHAPGWVELTPLGLRYVVGHFLENTHHYSPVIRSSRLRILIFRDFFGSLPSLFVFKCKNYADWHDAFSRPIRPDSD